MRHFVPGLKWATYPRSITTPAPDLAQRVRELVDPRRGRNIDPAVAFTGT
jgi:hypothetical protein